MLLCQHKFHMKSITFLYSGVQQCQVRFNFVFYVFRHSVKERDHVGRKVNSKIIC